MTDLDEMLSDRDDLLQNPTVEGAQNYHRKYSDPEVDWESFHDEGLLGGIHKARIALGIGVDESTAWLTKHGMTLDIPDEFLP